MLLLQNVVCESEFRCEPTLRGESYHGVCFGQLDEHVIFHSLMFSTVALCAIFFSVMNLCIVFS